MKPYRTPTVAFAVIAATMGATGVASATAPRSTSTVTATPQVERHLPVRVDAAAHPAGVPADACRISTVYGIDGWTPCNDLWSSMNWGGGNIQYFAIGTDYGVYTIWRGASSWVQLNGGWASSKPSVNSVENDGNPSNLIVHTIGTDGWEWCDQRGNGNWSGWYRQSNGHC